MCMTSLSKYTRFVFCALLLSTKVYSSGITGSAGNELLYIYLLLLSFFLLMLGIDYGIKFSIRKFQEWKRNRQTQALGDLS